MRAWSKLTESGDVSYYNQSTTDVTQRALRESSEDLNDERENNTLKEVDKSCIVLYNYCIYNYKKHQHIIGGFKEKHFLVGEGIFLIS
jgi:hypothetical protein